MKTRRITVGDIKKGLRFYWSNFNSDFTGWYEIVCYKKYSNSIEIYAYKSRGKESTVNRGGQLAIFDERIINDRYFHIKESI